MKRLFFIGIAIFWASGIIYAQDSSNATASIVNATNATAATETPTQMLDFDLASYGEGGKKAWEIKGESADILSDVVRLSNIEANFYGKEEDMNLKADSGEYDKTGSKIHLEKNVVATTSSGAKLTTESLDWLQNERKITTGDIVNIQRENLEATAKGAQAQLDLKKIFLKEEPKVNILHKEKDKPETSKTTITCEGPLEIDYEKETAVFNKNVVAHNPTQGDIYCDKMTVHFAFKEKKINNIVCQGNVKIVKGENISKSDEAVYDAKTGKIVLTGRPQLTIFSEEGVDFGAAFGAEKDKK